MSEVFSLCVLVFKIFTWQPYASLTSQYVSIRKCIYFKSKKNERAFQVQQAVSHSSANLVCKKGKKPISAPARYSQSLPIQKYEIFRCLPKRFRYWSRLVAAVIRLVNKVSPTRDSEMSRILAGANFRRGLCGAFLPAHKAAMFTYIYYDVFFAHPRLQAVACW